MVVAGGVADGTSATTTNNHSGPIQAGNVGRFLLNACLNGMSNERLVGPIPAPPPDHHRVAAAMATRRNRRQQQQQQQQQTSIPKHSGHSSSPYQNLVTITNFLADYRARMTIAENSQHNSGSNLGFDFDFDGNSNGNNKNNQQQNQSTVDTTGATDYLSSCDTRFC